MSTGKLREGRSLNHHEENAKLLNDYLLNLEAGDRSPHTLTAYAAHATGASDQSTYLWIQYLLLSLWPIAVYLGARLLGWARWTAAAPSLRRPPPLAARNWPRQGDDDLMT